MVGATTNNLSQEQEKVWDRPDYPPKGQPIKPFKEQWQILQSNARFLGLNAGTGGGKTWFGPVWLLEEIRKYPEDNFMIVAPIYKMVKRRPVELLFKYFAREGIIRDIHYNYRRQEGEIEFTTGAHIYLASADRPDTMEGNVLRAIWADEAGQMGRKAWDVMRRRTGFKEGRILVTSTPYCRNWFITDLVAKGENKKYKNYFAVTYPSIKNPHYPRSVYYEEKRKLPPDEFNRKYNAIATARHGLVYSEFDSDKHIIKPIDITNEYELFAGIDWGQNHPFVFELFAYHPETDMIYNCWEYSTTGKELYQIAGELAPHLKDKNIVAYYDPSRSGGQLKHELQQWGVYNVAFRKADNDRENGILTVRKWLFQDKYRIFDTCKLNIEQKGLWSWIEEESGEYADKAEKKYDDSQDAERYALHTKFGKQTKPRVYSFEVNYAQF